ncbi:hypothetical protein BKA63DRAFT_108686 [Paraphoma chrysanthemicola]|nr:hypothetical protein BKA63DRAFT_108686 [Paraphoma chrysanthemicola]
MRRSCRQVLLPHFPPCRRARRVLRLGLVALSADRVDIGGIDSLNLARLRRLCRQACATVRQAGTRRGWGLVHHEDPYGHGMDWGCQMWGLIRSRHALQGADSPAPESCCTCLSSVYDRLLMLCSTHEHVRSCVNFCPADLHAYESRSNTDVMHTPEARSCSCLAQCSLKPHTAGPCSSLDTAGTGEPCFKCNRASVWSEAIAGRD